MPLIHGKAFRLCGGVLSKGLQDEARQAEVFSGHEGWSGVVWGVEGQGGEH